MTRPLSVEVREAIVKAYNEGLGTAKDIARIFSITEKSVFRYLKQKRETGDLSARPIPGRPPILTNTNLEIIKEIVVSNNELTLEEYRFQFYQRTGIEITIVTIFNACRSLNLNRKKKASTHQNKIEKM